MLDGSDGAAVPDAAPGLGAPPRLAILFWCYKRLGICCDRLRHLRQQNPDAPIFVLFGGDHAAAPRWQQALAPFVDDFYLFDDPPPPDSDRFRKGFRGGDYWKYTFGDLLIAAWFRDRGAALVWDTVVVVQWDMLVYGRIEDTFGCLRRDEVLFSGLRPVGEVADRWVWTTHPLDRSDFEEFVAELRRQHGFAGEPMSCVAIVVCLSRAFLERYVAVDKPHLGFLEYRLPTYAKVFGVPFCSDHPFRPWWGAVEPYRLTHTLRARPREIWAPVIAWNLLHRDGARVFHPYWRRTPRGLLRWSVSLLDAVPRLVVTALFRAGRRLTQRRAR